MRLDTVLAVCVGLGCSTALLANLDEAQRSLHFEPNLGQDSSGSFICRTAGSTLYVDTDGSREPSLLIRFNARQECRAAVETPAPEIRISFVGSSGAAVSGDGLLPGSVNYILGNRPSAWLRDIPRFERVRLSAVWPGVDVELFPCESGIQYDLFVSPGVAVNDLEMRVDGIDELTVDGAGNLVATVTGSNISLTQRAPKSFEILADGRQELDSRFVLTSTNTYRFEVYGWDTRRPLVIDPPVNARLRNYAFVNGLEGDNPTSVDIDTDGNVFVAGTTSSFPNLAPECFPSRCRRTPVNAFVSKYAPDLTFEWITVFGGNGRDLGNALQVGLRGHPYVVGLTLSDDLPTTVDAVDSTFDGVVNESGDGFLAKFDKFTGGLLYATYVGGGDYDEAKDVVVETRFEGPLIGGTSREIAHITGYTSSVDFPVTLPRNGLNGKRSDAFVFAIEAGADAPEYGRYLGGTHNDRGEGIVLGDSGVIVCGVTESSDFPVVSGGLQVRHGGGEDGFVTWLDSSGNIVEGIYLGGPGDDRALDLDVRGNSTWVTGRTDSLRGFQEPQGHIDAFLIEIVGHSSRGFYEHFGGSSLDEGRAVATGPDGDLTLVGVTHSADLVVSPDALTASANPQPGEGLIVRVNEDGTWLSHVGGSSGFDIAADVAARRDSVYVCGATSSADFAFFDDGQNLLGPSDGYVVRLSGVENFESDVSVHVSASPRELERGSTVNFNASVRNTGPESAFGLQLDFDIEAGVDLWDVLPVECTWIGDTIRCERDLLEVGETWSVLIQSVAPRRGSYLAIARVESLSNDTDTSNNESRARASVFGPDLEAMELEVTQGLQNLDHDIELIERRSTFVRFFAQGSDGNGRTEVTGVSAALHGSRDGIDLPGSPLSPMRDPIDLPQAWSRASTGGEFVFLLPYTWRRGEVTLEAQIDPKNIYVELDETNNRRSKTVSFQEAAPICIVTYPVLAGTGPAPHPRFLLDDPLGQRIVRRAEALLPVHEIAIFPREHILDEFAGGPYEFGDKDEGEENDGWKVLIKLFRLDQLSNDPNSCDRAHARTHYMGMVPTAGTSDPSGAAYVGLDQSWIRLLEDDSDRGSFSNPLGGRTLAHELGHNYGRWHVDCGDPEDTDDNFPHDPCEFGPAGWRSFMGFDEVSQAVLAPTDHGDLMSYAWTRWTSDYTWQAIGRDLIRRAAKLRSPALAGGHGRGFEEPDEVVLVSGVVSATGDHLCELMRLDASMLPPEKLADLLLESREFRGDVVVELYDGAGAVLFAEDLRTFAMSETEDRVFFGAAIPYVSQARRLTVRWNEELVASEPLTAAAPRVQLIAPGGGELAGEELTAVWDASDEDSEVLTFTLQYSPDGESWRTLATDLTDTMLTVDTTLLPGSRSARLRVIASDGFNTATSTSDAFELARHAPQVRILSPREGSILAPEANVLAIGAATDVEDGPQNDEDLSWFVDGRAEGRGRDLLIAQLPEGRHELRLVARDSDGNESEDIVSFFVGSGGDGRFDRGDANADGSYDISDGIYTLVYLFIGGVQLPCDDSADADDSGNVDITDAVRTFGYLFSGGLSPPAPFESCGLDPSDDDLGCEMYDPCS